MKKRFLICALIACAVFSVNLNTVAAEADKAAGEVDIAGKHVRKAGGFDRTRPNNFTETMKGIGRYLLYYIPNRLADASDMFTMELSIGGAFAAEMQATRYCQLGGSYGESWFVAKAYDRQFGVGHKDTNHFGLICFEKDITFVDETSEGMREYVIDFPQFAVADYHLDAFADEDVDFWKIGGRIGWIIGAGFGIHPVEIADFITGFFWLDFKNDDF